MKIKQVIVICSNGKFERGKECAKIVHAAGMFMRSRLIDNRVSSIPSNEELLWMHDNIQNIEIKTADVNQLQELHINAKQRGLTSYFMVDSESPMVVAIGPHKEENFIGLTDYLSTY